MAHRSKSTPASNPSCKNDVAAEQIRRDRNWLYGERDDGRRCGFVMIPNAFVHALPLDLAAFLAILADWERRKSEPEHDGWFYFPTARIAQTARSATKRVQERLFRQLRALGVIKTRMTGGRGTTHRWIWINWHVVWDLAADFVESGMDLDGGGSE